MCTTEKFCRKIRRHPHKARYSIIYRVPTLQSARVQPHYSGVKPRQGTDQPSQVCFLRSPTNCAILCAFVTKHALLTTTTLAVDSLPFFTANEHSLNDTYLRPSRFQLSSLGKTLADGHDTPRRFSSAPYMKIFILRLQMKHKAHLRGHTGTDLPSIKQGKQSTCRRCDYDGAGIFR